MNAEPDEREWWAAREIKHLRAINAELLAALEVAQKLAASGPAPLPPSDPRWAQIADAIAKAKREAP